MWFKDRLIMIELVFSESVGRWGEEECGLLCQMTAKIVKSAQGGLTTNPELLNKITKPFTKAIIQVLHQICASCYILKCKYIELCKYIVRIDVIYMRL
jgi:hypothetical protein